MIHYKKTAVIMCTAAVLFSAVGQIPQVFETVTTAITASAEEISENAVTLNIGDGNIVITSTGYSVGGSGEITYTGDYIITGTTTEYSVTVTGSHHITIRDINIDNSGHGYNANYQSLNFSGADECTLTVEGENTIKANGNTPAIYVPGNNKRFTINGNGILNAYGGSSWPAIGRNNNGNDNANIVITDVTLNAHGGSNAAGIGGSWGFGAGNITIDSATVNAWGGYGRPGIGCGSGGGGGSISISNSVIKSYYGNGSQDQLGDSKSPSVSTITIKGSIVNGIHHHDFDYNFYWDGFNSSKAARSCRLCDEREEVECVVTKEQNGYDIKYTATATFSDGTVKTDTKTETLSPYYTVTIPAKAAVDEEFSVTADVKYILDTEQVSVSVNNETDFKMKLENHTDTTLDYVLTKNGSNVVKGSNFLTAGSGQQIAEKLTVKTADGQNPQYAGNYKGTLYFDIKLENK